VLFGKWAGSKTLGRLNPENDDQKVGIDIVRRALQGPARQIFGNAGRMPRSSSASSWTKEMPIMASMRRPAIMST
jgi:chaperonin GroEL (HSP60 family)